MKTGSCRAVLTKDFILLWLESVELECDFPTYFRCFLYAPFQTHSMKQLIQLCDFVVDTFTLMVLKCAIVLSCLTFPLFLCFMEYFKIKMSLSADDLKAVLMCKNRND